MPSGYPSALDSLGTSTTNTTVADTTHPALHNDANDAINKIEAELGTDPSASFTTVRARLDAMTTVRKTADQTISSNATLGNVTDLVFPVLSGVMYRFNFLVMYQSNTATNGVRLGVTTPTFAAGSLAYAIDIFGRATPTAGTQPSATSGLGTYSSFGAASGTAVASDAVGNTNTSYIARVEGIVVPNASGSIQLQAANEVSTANGNIIKAGSHGVLWTG